MTTAGQSSADEPGSGAGTPELALVRLGLLLDEAFSVDDLYATVVDQARTLTGASAAALVLLDDTGDWIQTVATVGYDPDVVARFDRFRADADMPLAEAVRTERPLLLGHPMAHTDRYDAYRQLAEAAGRKGTACLPLSLKGRVIGALGLSFDTPPNFDAAFVEFLGGLSERCAEGLGRAKADAVDSDELRQLIEAARGRLSFVSAASRELARTLDRNEVLETLTQLVVPRFADWASVLLPERDELVAATLVHRDVDNDLRGRAGRFRCAIDSEGASATVFRSRVPEVAPGIDDDLRARMVAYPELSHLLGQTRERLIVPITVQERPLGVLTLALAYADRPLYDDDDVAVAVELAGRAGTALDNADRYAAQQSMVVVLQRAVLPSSLPDVSGVALTARYLPATIAAQVGGDWYDAFVLRDGRLGLCVGDVVGHGVEAAACMGQLRNALRVYALDGSPTSEVVEALNRFAIDTAITGFTTLVYAVVDPASGVMEWTNAGHPPMLRRGATAVELFSAVHGTPVGVDGRHHYGSDAARLDPDDVLVLYTDGLIERREEQLTDGLGRLVATVEASPSDSVDALCDGLVAAMPGSARTDDICLLALRYGS